MENKMINVEVLEGSLVLSPLQSPKECELLFETWMLINSPDGLEDYSKNEIENIADKLNGAVEINAIAEQSNLQSLVMTYREKVENKEEYDKHFGIEIKRQGETKSPFPTEQLKEWAELILDSEEGQKLKDKMDEDFKNKIVLGIPQENIIDLGDSLFCQSIWDKPIKKSTSIKLGLYFSDIPVEQIPFDHTILNNDYDFIKNDYNETLFYQNGVYRLFTNDPTIYLENWFCKWEKSEIEKESGYIEQPQQDPVARLMELGYTEGKIFHRKNCDNYNCGYGIFTGEFGKNCDGITLKFTDGREFLSDFCTLIKDNSPQVMWDITKELQRLQNHYEDNITKFKQQYLNLK